VVGSVPVPAPAALAGRPPTGSSLTPGTCVDADRMRRNALFAAVTGWCATGAAEVGVGGTVGALVAVTTGADGELVSVGVTGGLGARAGSVVVGSGAAAVGVAGGLGVLAGGVGVGIGIGAVLVGVVVGAGAGVGGVAVGGIGAAGVGGALVGAGPVGTAVGGALVGAGIVAVGLWDGCWHPQSGWTIHRPVASGTTAADWPPRATPAAVSGPAAAIAVVDPVQVTAARPRTARAPSHASGRGVPALARVAGPAGRPGCPARASGALRAVPTEVMTSAAASPAAAAAGRAHAPRPPGSSSDSRPGAIPRAAR